MPVLTAARSAIARSGATRSDYPIDLGVRMPLYALSGVARAGAIRSNYHSNKVFVSIGGTQYAYGRPDVSQGILDGSLNITDALNATPNTARCTAVGFIPTMGQDVVVTLGSVNNLTREFGGQVLNSQVGYVERPENYQALVSMIDYTWGLNKRKVTGHYTGSASTVIQEIVSDFTSGYTVTVESGMPTVDGGITFTNEDVTDCLTRTMKRVGGDWYCDYHKVVRAFLTDTFGTNPTTINAVHSTLMGMRVSRDLSQGVTRVYIEGGGGTAFATVEPGETILPINGDILWYRTAAGIIVGVVVSGPQRITYTGVSNTGGGGLVGPGASPTGSPVLALVNGTGVDDGSHDYAVTFETTGETLPGALASITTGVVAAPSSALTTGTPTIGTGPNPGTHSYGLTFVTPSGETTSSPVVLAATTLTPAPTTAPVPGDATIGGSVTVGNHDYAVTFVTAIGETTPGPIGFQGATGYTSAPAGALIPGTATSGGSVDAGTHEYVVTNVTSVGETSVGPLSAPVTTGPVVEYIDPPGAPTLAVGSGFLQFGVFRVLVTFVTALGETTAGTYAEITVLAGGGIDLSAIPIGPTGTTGRNIYRTAVNTTTPYLLRTTLADNSTTTYTIDGSESIGGEPPTFNTAGVYVDYLTVQLSAIPSTFDPNVTSRKIYRRFNSAGTFKLLTTIGNPHTTNTYTDTTANASLGADAPTSHTATLNTIPLTGIPKGDANVTSRKLYRRSGGAGLKLLATIANNTATTYSDTTANASLGAAPPATSTAYLQRIPLSGIPIGPALVTSRKLYRSVAGAAQLKFLATIGDNTTTTFTDTVTDASLGADIPVTNTATANRVALTAIPIGAAEVTARNIYRTESGGTQLKLLAQLADNTTTTYTDTTADSSLGFDAPTTDTSGLAQPEGNVLPGSTTLQVANIGAFPTSGWAVIGNGQHAIRYTGISGNVLTGIPATGAGAIAVAISYGSTVTSPPQLTGIPASGAGSIQHAILKGDDVNIFVQVDDVAAQTALAALIGGDGIQEDYIQDRRLAYDECVARGEALLALRGAPLVTVTYQCRDINTRSSCTVTVNIGSPFFITATPFLIQQVTQTYRITLPQLPPLYSVTASSVRFSYEDLLRQTRG